VRKRDKLKVIEESNLRLEMEYLKNKGYITEDWKSTAKNVAVGAGLAAGLCFGTSCEKSKQENPQPTNQSQQVFAHTSYITWTKLDSLPQPYPVEVDMGIGSTNDEAVQNIHSTYGDGLSYTKGSIFHPNNGDHIMFLFHQGNPAFAGPYSSYNIKCYLDGVVVSDVTLTPPVANTNYLGFAVPE
jgi:cold shock CspA family protein